MRKKTSLWLIITGVLLLRVPSMVQAYTPTVCDCNLNEGTDTLVDVSDYGLLVNDFFSTNPANPKSDINQDGIVDITDYSWMIKYFLQTCTTTPATPVPGSTIINPGGNEPSNSVANIMNSKPAGTTFYFKKGYHRINDVLPIQSGDKLIGEKGAIISGARLFDNSKVKRDGDFYYFENQTQQSDPAPNGTLRGQVSTSASGTGYVCIASHVRCVYNEELFLNDKVYRHVESKDKVKAGDFYFDYEANRIYFKDNPEGKRIETSITSEALNNSLEENVLIKNLIFEKFATPAQNAAVEANGKGNIVEFNTFRWNHGTGVTIGTNGILRNNLITHNGHKGFGSGHESSNLLIEKNEIAYNTTSGFEPAWDAGANKFAVTTNAVFKQNYSHHNIGPGFWTDIDNIDSVYDGNIIEFNKGHGLQHEISFTAIIKNNYVAYNDKNQIFIQNSAGINGKFIEVFNNTVILGPNSQQGIVAQNEPRGNSRKFPEPWATKNVKVFDNKIYYTRLDDKGIIAGLYGRNRDDGGKDPHTFQWAAPSVSFTNNTYFIDNSSQNVWSWGPYWTKINYLGFRSSHSGETKTPQSVPDNLNAVRPVWNYPVGPQ